MPDKPIHDLPHWRLYQSLEEDLERCFKYIPPFTEHDQVHSEEFAKIILVASSEFENVLAEFKRETSFSCGANILEYYKCLSATYPKFTTMMMGMPRYSREFKPLYDWTADQAPDWWTNGYNKIKHNRLQNPKSPTLIRALYSVAGLQTILFHYYDLKFGEIVLPENITPKLIEPRLDLGGTDWMSAGMSSVYDIPK